MINYAFFFSMLRFCDIVKCSVDTKVLMAGRKRKIYPVLNCPNSVVEKSYDVFCLYLYFADIYQKIHQYSRINYFYLSKNDLERLLCCKQNKKCIEKQDFMSLSFYLKKKIICKLVTPGPIMSCQLGIK